MTKDDLTIEATIDIDADASRVWTVLTEPRYVTQWLGCMNYEKAIGHVFYMQQDTGKREQGDISGATHCRIVALDEPHRFAFSWFLPETPETNVEILLTSDGGGTRVTLRHTGWDKFDASVIRQIRDALAAGWTSAVLPNLKRVAESPD